MVCLSGEEVARFVTAPPEIKINPNGVDLRVSEIWKISEDSVSTLHGKIRETTEQVRIEPNGDFYELARGVYSIRVANEVSVPAGVVGFCNPRSTLNRLGMIKSQTGIWDSGYKGFGTQTVFIPIKLFRIHKDEFWFQLRMHTANDSNHSYDGHWQNEKPQ
jgi:deoxycytidine triphosphate deaminase